MIEQASLVLGNGNWAVKSDSLLGYKTIDGKYYPRDMTFTRATTGTRVNEAGLVELVPYNLLQRSEEFDNAIWTKTTASVVANATTSPIGTLTADNLIPNAVTFGLVQQTANITANVPNTFSIYVKYNGISTFQLQTRDNANNANVALVFFNVLTGVISVAPSASGAYSNASADIESVGNGLYRLSLTSTSNISVTSKFRLVGDLSDGVNGYFIWGAQLVEGTEPLDYLPTTDRLDIARIDYSTGEPALLLEPQRTNLILYSQDISNAAWTKSSGGTGSTPVVTANYTASPLEGKMADRVIFNLNGGTASADLSTLQSSSFNLTLGDNVTYYMAVKTNDGSTVNMTLNNNLGLSEVKSITPEWTIIKTSTTATSTSSGVLRLRLRGSEAVSDYADISVAYAQLEVGSYATSYIPTTTASVTRNAEQYDKVITSLVPDATTFTWEVDFIVPEFAGGGGEFFGRSAAGTTQLRLYANNNTVVRFRVESGAQNYDTAVSVGDTAKCIFRCSSGVVSAFYNGVKIHTFTGVTMDFGKISFGIPVTSPKIIRSLVFPTALTDAECIDLTTI